MENEIDDAIKHSENRYQENGNGKASKYLPSPSISIERKKKSLDKFSPRKKKFFVKIVKRYPSDVAVYREWMQNSDEAQASEAEIHFSSQDEAVHKVLYCNNGVQFSSDDWFRLKTIAEDNFDENTLDLFGAGTCTMFRLSSIPQIISGNTMFDFFWEDDTLRTRKERVNGLVSKWTSFTLPSQDPYPIPDIAEFGQYLCAGLTFTKYLSKIRVVVDNKERLVITKTMIQEPIVIRPLKSSLPKSSIWKKKSNAVTTSLGGLFFLSNHTAAIKEMVYEFISELDGETGYVKARFVTAAAKTRIPPATSNDIKRITRKLPPLDFLTQMLTHVIEDSTAPGTELHTIMQPLCPLKGEGRIFVGFRTSQTTGIGVHLMAPFVPNTERESINLQNPFLRQYNTELLEFCGIVTRLNLEHSMMLIESEMLQNDHSQSEKTSTRFAGIMSRGMKKKLISNMNNTENDADSFTSSSDPEELSSQEYRALHLMKAFCPQRSKPDPDVGTLLLKGFSRCMHNKPPPVLTRSGFLRGNEAALPCEGIESLVKTNIVRCVIYENAKDYHFLTARCRYLNLDDLSAAVTSEIIREDRMVLFVKWWAKYSSSGTHDRLSALMDNIRFYVSSSGDVAFAGDLSFYTDSDSSLADENLPLPPSTIPRCLQQKIGLSILKEPSLKPWFSALPMDIWVKFIGRHKCMTAGEPEDEYLRLQVLRTLSKEFCRRKSEDQSVFGSICQSILSDQRCIPFDSSEPTIYSTEEPQNLYLYSAEVRPFEKIGAFLKASYSLKGAEVSEDFLLALGVKRSVSLSFVFSRMDHLCWSDDPKPLVEYLLASNLNDSDWETLRTAEYLPSENDISKKFAPSELFFPDPELRMFPFVRLLQWVSETKISTTSPIGDFLLKAGVRCLPPLDSVLKYISEEVADERIRLQCLDFVCNRIQPKSMYYNHYSSMSRSKRQQYRILSSVTKSFLGVKNDTCELLSPPACFVDIGCAVMGFSIIDPKWGEKRELYGNKLECQSTPNHELLIQTLLDLVKRSKEMLAGIKGENLDKESKNVLVSFTSIFKYLSSRISDFAADFISSLPHEKFIPCSIQGSIQWYNPKQVFFKNSGPRNSVAEKLFDTLVDYSPFLASVGVREEVSLEYLFCNLDKLEWSNDPRPLIDYLLTSTLNKNDWEILRTTKYLTAENELSSTRFTPTELYIPDPELHIFSFIRFLKWPSEKSVSNKSSYYSFLIKIGVQRLPPLTAVLKYMSFDVTENKIKMQCLDFVCRRLQSDHPYHYDYSCLTQEEKRQLRILPSISKPLLSEKREVFNFCSPVDCFLDIECAVMGFSVVDPSLDEKGFLYGSLLGCAVAPESELLITQLLKLVKMSKERLSTAENEVLEEKSEDVMNTFSSIFRYLSSRISEFAQASLVELKEEKCIPCLINNCIEWYAPKHVFFKGKSKEQISVTDQLFETTVNFSPFLSFVGVQEEVSIDYLFLHWDNLRWTDNPKPLIEYLLASNLTDNHLEILKNAKFLPCDADPSGRRYSPSELYLPNSELIIFSFVRFLRWSPGEMISEKSSCGRFLLSLNLQTMPPLTTVLHHISNERINDELRIKCLDFVCNRLQSKGIYKKDFSCLSRSQMEKYRILPCIKKSIFSKGEDVANLCSPLECFLDIECAVMGFSIIDPTLGKKGNLYGNLFGCSFKPDSQKFTKQLLKVVKISKEGLSGTQNEGFEKESEQVMIAFSSIFRYLSSCISDFTSTSLVALQEEYFIPCVIDGCVKWYNPGQVFLKREKKGKIRVAEQVFNNIVDFCPFLSSVGAREVSLDYIFSHWGNLRWSDNPKLLVEHIRTLSLTKENSEILTKTAYLPSEDETSSERYIPSELYLPIPELQVFSFVRFLKWPSGEVISENTSCGSFLTSVGVRFFPPLISALQYVSEEVVDNELRIKCLDYVCNRLQSKGVYRKDFSFLSKSKMEEYRILPCISHSLFLEEGDMLKLCSPMDCFLDAECVVMGFSVVDPGLGEKGNLYGSLLGCPLAPEPELLLSQLLKLVNISKKRLNTEQKETLEDESEYVMDSFSSIFTYLSSCVPKFSSLMVESLQKESFIPCLIDGFVRWYRPEHVFFKTYNFYEDTVTGEILETTVSASPFLSCFGVRDEGNSKVKFQLLISSPEKVLNTLGSKKRYMELLKHFSVYPHFENITNEIEQSRFLLAETSKDEYGSYRRENNFALAKANDIYIIDNLSFAKMFWVKRAPQDVCLHKLYLKLGSSYISKEVVKKFEVIGKSVFDTRATHTVRQRINERVALLSFPSIFSKALLPNAMSLLEDNSLLISEVPELSVIHSLGNSKHRQNISCCCLPVSGSKNNMLYVTKNFEWFDVSQSICNLIVEGSGGLMDFFFISSVFEASLEQLETKGFPVGKVAAISSDFIPEPDSTFEI